MSQENVDLTQRIFEAFNQLDTDAVRESWTADAEWRPAFTGGGLVEGAVYRGPDEIAAYIESQRDTWKTIQAEAIWLKDLGTRVLAHVRTSAVGRGSGVPVERLTWNVFEFRDGKVAGGCVYTTEADALEAVGLSE